MRIVAFGVLVSGIFLRTMELASVLPSHSRASLMSVVKETQINFPNPTDPSSKLAFSGG